MDYFFSPMMSVVPRLGAPDDRRDSQSTRGAITKNAGRQERSERSNRRRPISRQEFDGDKPPRHPHQQLPLGYPLGAPRTGPNEELPNRIIPLKQRRLAILFPSTIRKLTFFCGGQGISFGKLLCFRNFRHMVNGPCGRGAPSGSAPLPYAH